MATAMVERGVFPPWPTTLGACAPPVASVATVSSPRSLRLRAPSPEPQRSGKCSHDLDTVGDEESLLAIWNLPEERKAAILLLLASGSDLGVGCLVVIAAVRFAFKDGSASLGCLGVQALSHMVSSLLLVLRMFGELLPDRDPEERSRSVIPDEDLRWERDRQDVSRERKMGVVLGAAMMASAAALLASAIRKFLEWDQADPWQAEEQQRRINRELHQVSGIIAFFGLGWYAFQTAARLFGSWRLRRTRAIVRHCCAVSCVCFASLMALGLTAIYEREWSWRAEPIVACILALATLAEGARTVSAQSGEDDCGSGGVGVGYRS